MFKNNISIILKQAFEIKEGPFPWTKAMGAAVCSGTPVILGLLLNEMNLGLLGVIGSFSYLYVFNEPYAQRAKKIFLAAVGISISVGLGTLAAPYPLLVALIVGIIGTLATFLFGVFKIPGPAAVFFVMSFTMTTGMTIDPSAALTRTCVVFMSGCLAWIISMLGYFFNPHSPEIKAVKKVYLSLEKFSEAVGGEDIRHIRQLTVNALREAEEVLLTGHVTWKNSFLFNKLFLLNEQANKLFLEILELHFAKKKKLPRELINMIKILSCGIELRDGEIINITSNKQFNEEYKNFFTIIYDIEAIMNIPLNYIGHGISITQPSLKDIVSSACSKDSIIFINSIRYGIILSISTIIAFNFQFTRPYWVTLSCAAVMLGSTILSTFHRAIQRSCGTIIGLLVAFIILSFHPQGFMMVAINVCLTILVELSITKNYALASVFITPNALLIAETSSQIHNISYFISARIVDIVIGSIIGLIGTYIIGYKSASSRLEDLAVKLIRSQAQTIIGITTINKKGDSDSCIKWIKEKMKINVVNFKMAYTTALGEIPRNEEMLEMMWPAFFSLEHISYLIEQGYVTKGRLNLSDEELAQLLLVFETIAIAIEQNIAMPYKKIPILNEIPKICEELNILQEALSIKSKYDEN